MRVTVLILVTIQLMLSGAFGSHVHWNGQSSGSDEHVSRPHIHLTGHSHSHSHSRHEHSHPVAGEKRDPSPVGPAPDERGHDEDAIYVSAEPIVASGQRVVVPDPLWEGWVARSQDEDVQTVCTRPAFDRDDDHAGRETRTDFQLLPHLLRI